MQRVQAGKQTSLQPSSRMKFGSHDVRRDVRYLGGSVVQPGDVITNVGKEVSAIRESVIRALRATCNAKLFFDVFLSATTTRQPRNEIAQIT